MSELRQIEEVTLRDGRELKEVLDLHEKWLEGEEGGVKAELSNEDLSYVNLSNSDLSYCNLSHSDLSNSDLSFGLLFNCNLAYSDLSYVDLSYCNLACSDLRNCDLYNSNLHYSNLSDAKLDNIKANNTLYFELQCPKEGTFTGYKKAIGVDGENVIVKLQITEDSKRSSATTNKCRCSKAKVLSITSIDGKSMYKEAHSSFDGSFVYKVGDIESVKDFDDNRWNGCSTGIHFFMSREEAVNYNLY